MGDVGLAIQRAEDKTAQMQARAGAIDELLASGALEDHVSGGNDYIQAELDKLGATGSALTTKLEAMKREIANKRAEADRGQRRRRRRADVGRRAGRRSRRRVTARDRQDSRRRAVPAR